MKLAREEQNHVVENTNETVDEDTDKSTDEVISAVAVPEEASDETKIKEYLESMTIEEKVAQMFIILPEALTGVDCVTSAGETTQAAIEEYPVGGFIYLDNNLQDQDQVAAMLSNTQRYSVARSGLPAFLCIDEEGGTVARISGTGKFAVPKIEDMAIVGATGDTRQAYEKGLEMGAYLSALGFNVDFAPDADVLTNPRNKVVKRRSFGDDPQLVADMSRALIEGLGEYQILGAYKHFPGHGATQGDTHKGYAYTDKSLAELKASELIPFQRGIEEGVPFIMVGHISLPTITGDDTPASLSKHMIDDILRKEMQYEGVVITDAMNMGAIVNNYSAAEASVQAVLAGVDIILMPEDFHVAYQAVLDAVAEGTISVERIDESVARIIEIKQRIKY